MLTPVPSNPPDDYRDRVRSSAAWAAYGDALGFITELADSRQVHRRAGGYPVTKLVAWKRRVGGRGGPSVELPAGCISDDTQLRLSVSRCLGPGGFDIEAFSKIELTVWPGYALGAGRGSKAAAAHMARNDVSWATNFFGDGRINYVEGGGNGAAMRVQPHVWASSAGRPWHDLIGEVLVDAVVTHGHARGLMGAAFHALCLQRALTGRRVGPDDWRESLSCLVHTADLVSDHPELGGIWLNMWEQRDAEPFARQVMTVVDEIEADLVALERVEARTFEGAYRSAVEALEAFRPEQRGSATKTAVLAAWLAWAAPDASEAVLVAANQLGTDTDSIGTMAGALMGAAEITDAPSVVDSDYIAAEADRMTGLATGQPVAPFPYPDLRSFAPPRTQSDALLGPEEELQLAGLGPAKPVTGEILGTQAGAWVWVDLWFGQRVLVKRRPRLAEPRQPVRSEPSYLQEPSRTPTTSRVAEGLGETPPAGAPPPPSGAETRARASESQRPAEAAPARAVEPAPDRPPPRNHDEGELSLHELSDRAIRADFDATLIGRHLLLLADGDEGIERALAYAAIIAKGRLSRRDRERRRNEEEHINSE